jgi:phosphatidylethanolamine-binding protein (PEBP) family uncharacterized protein
MVIMNLLLAGCGGASSTSHSASASTSPANQGSAETKPAAVQPTTTSAASEKVPVASIEVMSTVPFKPLPARYTCDGANISPPIEWTKVPSGTAEVDLFVVSALPINGRFVVSWALAGLKPSVRKLSAGHVPAGTIVGMNSFGHARYSFCPAKGSKGQYAILLYAVPHMVPVKSGFDAEALFEGKLVHIAPAEGEAYISYTRK